MLIGAVKALWGQTSPYISVTPVRGMVGNHTQLRHDLPSQHDLPRQFSEDSRLAHAATISLRQIDQLDRLLDPVE